MKDAPGGTLPFFEPEGVLSQLEGGYHGAEGVGMFFFDDNTFVLRADDPVGARGSRTDATGRTNK